MPCLLGILKWMLAPKVWLGESLAAKYMDRRKRYKVPEDPQRSQQQKVRAAWWRLLSLKRESNIVQTEPRSYAMTTAGPASSVEAQLWLTWLWNVNTVVCHANPDSHHGFCTKSIIYEDLFHCCPERGWQGGQSLDGSFHLAHQLCNSLWIASSWQVNVISGEDFHVNIHGLWDIFGLSYSYG